MSKKEEVLKEEKSKKEKVKTIKKDSKKKEKKKEKKQSKESFFIGVKKEMGKVRWPLKKEMVKYSIATLTFILFFAIFFTLGDLIIAGFKTLVG